MPVNFANIDRIALYGAIELTVSPLAISLSKISFGVTLIRLTNGWVRYCVYFTIVTLAAFVVPISVYPWTLCKPLAKSFVDILPGTCVDKQPSLQYARFQASRSSAMYVLTEGISDKFKYGLR